MRYSESMLKKIWKETYWSDTFNSIQDDHLKKCYDGVHLIIKPVIEKGQVLKAWAGWYCDGFVSMDPETYKRLKSVWASAGLQF